jgi:hypothetical protein
VPCFLRASLAASLPLLDSVEAGFRYLPTPHTAALPRFQRAWIGLQWPEVILDHKPLGGFMCSALSEAILSVPARPAGTMSLKNVRESWGNNLMAREALAFPGFPVP